jgi:hypothetical protein
MKATYKIDSPEHLRATLTVNMTIEEWRAVKNSIDNSKSYHGDAAQFAQTVGSVINKAEETFVEWSEG